MASTVPPRDWTEIHWPDIARTDAARWIAVLPLAATEQHGPHLPLETDVLIGEAYLARVRELLPAALPVTFLPLQPVGISTEHIDYPGHADAADRRRVEGVDRDRRERRALRNPQAGDGDQPRRQQCGDVAGGAGSARASSDARRHHELVSLWHTGWIVFRRRDAAWHSWRRDRDVDHAGALSAERAEGSNRRFSPHQYRHGEKISLALGASAGPLRVADAGPASKAARSATPPKPPRRRASNCSITARARSANCSMTSTNSIRNCFFVNHKVAGIIPVTI